MMESGKIKIRIANNKMIVEMASSILFPSGKAKLSEEGEIALGEVASILSTIGDRTFQVAGHTDNIPIDNAKFASNWELSAARAVAVVEFMIEKGMAPENLSAAGYADTQPVAGNLSEEGRAQNRRIEIVLQPSLDELPDLSSLEKMVD
jgi:chemotaxis protein MotB